MIYVIDHKDSFTHNVIHQFSLFDKVECDDFSQINKSKLEKAKSFKIKILNEEDFLKLINQQNNNSDLTRYEQGELF